MDLEENKYLNVRLYIQEFILNSGFYFESPIAFIKSLKIFTGVSGRVLSLFCNF
jgi:hypothetical protein